NVEVETECPEVNRVCRRGIDPHDLFTDHLLRARTQFGKLNPRGNSQVAEQNRYAASGAKKTYAPPPRELFSRAQHRQIHQLFKIIYQKATMLQHSRGPDRIIASHGARMAGRRL